MGQDSGFQLSDHAARLYERDTVPMIPRPLAEMMLEHVHLHQGDRILDAACGTGIVTRVAIQRFGNELDIVGADLNPGMLAVAKENTPPTAVSIQWQQGDLCALPFPDGRFDVVLCQNGLQFVPDK